MSLLDKLNERGKGRLPGLIGLEVLEVGEGAEGFTTVELKSNFLGTKRDGAIACEATLVHGGRATQVWDATVADEGSGKKLALFRCTQMILYGR